MKERAAPSSAPLLLFDDASLSLDVSVDAWNDAAIDSFVIDVTLSAASGRVNGASTVVGAVTEMLVVVDTVVVDNVDVDDVGDVDDAVVDASASINDNFSGDDGAFSSLQYCFFIRRSSADTSSSDSSRCSVV